MRPVGLGCLLVFFMLMAFPGSASLAWADVGVPPWALQPSALAHGEGETGVAMLAEDVIIRVEEQEGNDIFTYGNERYAASALISEVEAVFQMRNTGDADEAFDVWFPLWLPNYPWGGQVVPIQDFRVWVDGRQVPVQGLTLESQTGMDLEEGQAWAVWPVTFPAGEDLEIRVAYEAYPIGELPYGVFEYILATGADWAGSIGSGQITFILPYDVNEWNVIPPDGEVNISGNEVVLSFHNLEPTDEDNVSLIMLAPDIWREVAPAQEDVEANPGSSLAQLGYAHAAMRAVRVMKAQALSVGLSGVYAEAARDAFNIALAINADAFMVDDAVTYLSLLFYMGDYEAWDPPGELLTLLERALERQPGAYSEVVEYIQMLSMKWEMEFWSEEDGTEHVPAPPSAALLALVAQVVDLSPEPITYFSRWVTWALEGVPAVEPSPMPINPSEPTTTPQDSDMGGEPGLTETAPQSAARRFCPGAVGLFILPLAVYTLRRKPRSSGKKDPVNRC